MRVARTLSNQDCSWWLVAKYPSNALVYLRDGCARLPTYAYEVRALTFEVSDNFGSNDVRPCGAYGPRIVVRWLGSYHPSNMLECLRDRSALTIVH